MLALLSTGKPVVFKDDGLDLFLHESVDHGFHDQIHAGDNELPALVVSGAEGN